MSQRLYIQFLREEITGIEEIIDVPVVDTISIEAKSTFSTMGEMVPGLESAKNTLVGLKATATGGLSAGELEVANQFDLKKWQKTDPLRINTKVSFHTKTDAKKDVFEPASKLISYSILTKETTPAGATRYVTPGISIESMKQVKGKEKITAKLISFEIPGVVYIPLALIEQAVPTVSKERTQSGFPLWITVDIVVSSLFPANSDYFDQATDLFRDFTASELTRFQLSQVAF